MADRERGGNYGKPNGRADEHLISETKRVILTRDCGIPEMTPETAVYVTTSKDITPQDTVILRCMDDG